MFKEFLSFRIMISYQAICILYRIGALLLIGVGIFMMFQSDWESAFKGFLVMTVGNLFWRLICEGSIIFFSAHEHLVAIRKLMEEKRGNL